MDSFNPFSSSSSSSSSSSPSSSTLSGSNQSGTMKAQLMAQIREEASLSQARSLIEKVNSNCFTACVPTPGPSLSSKEEKCFTQCMEKYMAAWNTVSRAYIGKLQRERENMGITGPGQGGMGI